MGERSRGFEREEARLHYPSTADCSGVTCDPFFNVWGGGGGLQRVCVSVRVWGVRACVSGEREVSSA